MLIGFWVAFTVKSNKYKKDCLFLFLNFIFFLTVISKRCSEDLIVEHNIKISKIKNLDHYYISNPIVKKKVSIGLVNINKDKMINKCIKMKTDRTLNKLPNTTFEPKKSKKYFINKYLNNLFL